MTDRGRTVEITDTMVDWALWSLRQTGAEDFERGGERPYSERIRKALEAALSVAPGGEAAGQSDAAADDAERFARMQAASLRAGPDRFRSRGGTT